MLGRKGKPLLACRAPMLGVQELLCAAVGRGGWSRGVSRALGPGDTGSALVWC